MHFLSLLLSISPSNDYFVNGNDTKNSIDTFHFIAKVNKRVQIKVKTETQTNEQKSIKRNQNVRLHAAVNVDSR